MLCEAYVAVDEGRGDSQTEIPDSEKSEASEFETQIRDLGKGGNCRRFLIHNINLTSIVRGLMQLQA